MLSHFNAYDRAMVKIEQELLKLGELVGERLSTAMDSLVNINEQAANLVIAGDDDIDFKDEEIEMQSLELILLQQPVDDDLRFLAATMRISRDLERIGDYAGDIAEAAMRLSKQAPYFKPLIDIPRMGDLVQAMMKRSLKAHIHRDLTVARQMDNDDVEVDRLFVHLLQELTAYMKKGPEYVDQASDLLLVARYLERIGDHVVNISEMTIFAATGERHPFKQRKLG